MVFVIVKSSNPFTFHARGRFTRPSGDPLRVHWAKGYGGWKGRVSKDGYWSMGWILQFKDMDMLLIWLALHSQEDFQKSANGKHQMQPVASPPSVNDSNKTRVNEKGK